MSLTSTVPNVATQTAFKWYNASTCRYGQFMKVGTTELPGDSSGAARILDKTQHSAFANLTGINYLKTTPEICSNNGDCANDLCGDLSDPTLRCRCVDGACVSEHGTQVMSRVAATNTCLDVSSLTQLGQQQLDDASLPWTDLVFNECEEGEFMASRVELFIANNRRRQSDHPELPRVSDMVEAYEWFETEGVKIITESYGFVPGNHSMMAALRDYYSRKHGMLFIQATGNPPDARRPISSFCQGLGTICVGALQTDGTPGVDPDDWIGQVGAHGFEILPGAFLNWQFGASQSQPIGTYRRSVPDISSHGDAVDVIGWPKAVPSANTVNDSLQLTLDTTAGPKTIDLWRRQTGTSFAAPAVAAAVALHAETCGGVPRPDQIRARLRTGSSLNSIVPYELEHPFIDSGDWDTVCTSTVAPDTTYPHLGAGSIFDGCDFKAGVGGLYSGALRERPGTVFPKCPVTSLCSTGGGSPPPAPSTCAPVVAEKSGLTEDQIALACDDGETAEFSDYVIDDDFSTASHVPPGKVGKPVFTRTGLTDGFTIRSTLSYFACPVKTPFELMAWESEQIRDSKPSHWGGLNSLHNANFGDLTVKVDFDLRLVGQKQPFDPFVLIKESAYPVEPNEGFYFSTTESWHQIQVEIIAPEGFEPCDQKFNPDNSIGEPMTVNTLFFRYFIASLAKI